MQLPDGWTVAERSQRSMQVVQQFNFGSACLVMRDGSSINHAGNPCPGAEIGQLLNVSNFLAGRTGQQRILIRAPLPVPVPSAQSRSLNMRVRRHMNFAVSQAVLAHAGVCVCVSVQLLIVSTTGDASDTQLGIAQQGCLAFGSPCDVWAATPTATTPSNVLTSTVTQCWRDVMVNVVVYRQPNPVAFLGPHQGQLLRHYCDPGLAADQQQHNRALLPSLSCYRVPVSLYSCTAQNTALLTYCRAFRVDIVSLYSFPVPALGVTVNNQAPGGAANTNTRFTAAVRTERWISGIV